MDWDTLRTFEAVARLGSLTAAAKALGLSQSTVSRHLGRLEDRAGVPLLLRESPVKLTDRGEAVLAAVLPMVEAALSVESALEAPAEPRGPVTVTTVGELVRWVLVDALPSLFETHPHIELRILADNQVSSLAAGEADVAIRLGRPTRGDLVVRKIRTEGFDFYVSPDLEVRPDLPWLGYTGSLAQIPEQRRAEEIFSERPARLLVEDVEALGRAVEAGLGGAFLPRLFARRLKVVPCAPEDCGGQDLGPLAPREIWMVVHRSKHRLPHVRAVMEWLVAVFDGLE